MATPFQTNHWGKEYDNLKVTSDIPGAPSPIVGLSRDQYISNKAKENPTFNARARDSQERNRSQRKIDRDRVDFINQNIPFAAAISDTASNVEKTATQTPGRVAGVLANKIGDYQTESEYYNATGENLPAEAIYAVGDINEAAATSAGILSQEKSTAQEAEQQIGEGGLPVVNPGESPSAAVASMNNNRIKGVGSSTGSLTTPTPPKPPSPQERQKMAFEETGNKLSFDQNKIPEWYDSKSFSAGLLSFGLNLLSGNDLATSFNQASNLFMNTFGEEKRSVWAEDLAANGYDPTEIEEWVRTGDSKILTSADERKQKQIQMQTSLMQLDNLQYENSDEMRQYKLGRESMKDQLEQARFNEQVRSNNAQLGLGYARLNYEKQKQAAKDSADNPFGLPPRVLSAVQRQSMPYMRDAQLKAARLDQAVSSAEMALKLFDQGKPEEATKMYNGSQEAYTKGFKGGFGGVTGEDIQYHSANPNMFGRYYEKANSNLTGSVSREELVRQYGASVNASKAEHGAMKNYVQALNASLASELGPERAQQVTNLISTSTGMGQINGYYSPDQESDGNQKASASTVEFY